MEHFNSFIEISEANIDVDWENLGGHKAVCIEMINSIIVNLRNCVSIWFSTGKPDGGYNYELFIELFNKNFENKIAARMAGEKFRK